MSGFGTRLHARIARFGPLCVGIDPARATLAACGLPDSAEGAFAFGRRVLECVDHELAIVKPQSAYFERFGSAGLQALEQLAQLARRREVLVLYDGKRGDIDATAQAYGEAFFGSASPLRVDALTVHAYLGFDALRDLLALALRNDGGVFVVVRSSNPEGEALQHARLADGSSVAEHLCRAISAYNRAAAALTTEAPSDPPQAVGAVVGATCADAAETVAVLPHSYILAPGVGAQGATLDDVARRMRAARGRVLPSVSRAVIANGGDAGSMRAAILALREQARALV
jgi:orotidine-5'-phosphate decarboxylase